MTKLYDTPDEDEDEVSEGETLGSQDTEGSSEEEEEEFYQAPIRQRGTKAASKKKQTSMDSDCNSCRNRIAAMRRSLTTKSKISTEEREVIESLQIELWEIIGEINNIVKRNRNIGTSKTVRNRSKSSISKVIDYTYNVAKLEKLKVDAQKLLKVYQDAAASKI
ncbi:33K [White sturgeon adenovirus 1]|uniref:33K n=1 Tax=White sturgeon adenovirus 1 TaxID=2580388 RepID=A0A4V1F590_9ADEN|nr:33K [White sturgeon adenovirus 1]QCQ84163.1 33K [White sturgeon adenovirus 1]